VPLTPQVTGPFAVALNVRYIVALVSEYVPNLVIAVTDVVCSVDAGAGVKVKVDLVTVGNQVVGKAGGEGV
jgi:hypothetical protein